jgi:DNA-binding CsgD family transcriptional regulator
MNDGLPGDVVGRGEELHLIDRLLAPGSQATRALSLEGEPGVGKSTLLEYAVAVARRDGWAVLVARPAPIEVDLSFAALGDLLRGLEAEREQLAAPRRRALDVALLDASAGDEPVDSRAVSVAVMALLEQLAGRCSVLLAIDDAQWMDATSASAIRFAARRLRDVPVRWLVTRRLGNPVGGAPINALLSIDAVSHVVGGMNLAELHRLVDLRLGVRLPRTLLVRIERASGGNPFYALELARHVVMVSGAGDPASDLIVPLGVRELVRQRLNAVPVSVQRLVAAAALASHPSSDLLGRVERLSEATTRRRIRTAVEAGILRVVGDEVEFTHPLLAATAASDTAQVERVRIHGRLANEVIGVEERARHRALAIIEPNTEVADELERAAERARQRGAPMSAGELVALAIDRTPLTARHDLERRLLLAGDLAFQTGDTDRARSTLNRLDVAADPVIRTRALLVLARIAWLTWSGESVESLADRALAGAPTPLVRAEAMVALARLSRNDRWWGHNHATGALAILDALGDDAPVDLHVNALVAVLDIETDLGLPLRADLFDRAMAMAPADCPGRVADSGRYYLATILLSHDSLDQARDIFLGCLRGARDRADEGSLPTLYDQLSQLELLAGNWATARRYAQEQASIAEQNDQPLERLWGLETQALLDVREGVDGAVTRAESVLAQARATGDQMSTACALRTAAEAWRAAGDVESAATAYGEIDVIAASIHVLAPTSFRHAGDLIEALVELGRVGEAEARARSLDTEAHRGEFRWGIVAVARGSAAVLAAQGRLDAAIERAEASVECARVLGMPFEVGRSLLVLAGVQRRRRAKAAAAVALNEAAEVFERLGARQWVGRAVAERRRLGIRPLAPFDLTDTERMVAELAAEGLSNPEIAGRLSMSRKTVEFNLGKAYRKLQIRRRAQLSKALATRSRELPGSTARPPI